LSEFAGAARELDEAILVNPHDLDGIKGAIRDVLALDPLDARVRMRYLRSVVGRRDVHAWARDFLATLAHDGRVATPGYESVA
jgi:trehalose 6-phosphate synthase